MLPPVTLASGYRVSTRIRLAEPPPGDTGWTVELLFDATGEDTGYAVRFRKVTGVRYLALLRREGGETLTFAEGVTAFSFDRPHDLEVSVDGARLEVRLDGTVVARGNDVHRLRHDGAGVIAHGLGVEASPLQVTVLHDDPLPEPPVDDTAVALERPGLVRADGPSVEAGDYRLTPVTETWTGGREVVQRLEGRDAGGGWTEVGAGEWFLLDGEYGDRAAVYRSLSRRRLRFASYTVLDDTTVRFDAEVEGYDAVSLTWRLTDRHPVATVRFTPLADGRHLVLHHAGTAVDAVDEVLCGPLQHARMVRGPELLGAFELTAPLALVERDGWTRGVVVRAEDLAFADEQNKDPDDQPFGLSLRRPDGLVQPTVALPQYGRRADRIAGREYASAVAFYARPVPLATAYGELLRGEYGYRAYRRNVFGQSLTDTVFNLVDLLASGPAADDSENYQGSPSGWWSRAKGFIDIENDQAVRTTTTAVLLSAAYLTDDLDLYDNRARPMIEYHLSRNGYGWTPVPGYEVYGDPSKSALCASPFGVTALGPLHEMTRRQNPGIAALALTDRGSDQDYWLQRSAVSVPLATYRLTGDPGQLTAACEAADRYIAEQIDVAYDENVNPHDFAIYCARDWIGLLELYEETGEKRYLEGAHTEAYRFATQVFVRPVYDGDVTVPDRPPYHDRQIEMSGWWDPDALHEYPVTEIEPEPAPRWMLSLSGMTFEAMQTYRYSGPTFNPAFAAHLLRLAHHTGDNLLRDIAHNAVIGRYTNYPGYYFRQHTIAPLKPDFPFTGPFDNSTLYYHHAPGQLGMTIDYLLTEHETRSGGQVRFPAAFEENFVWFRFRTYGHRPGVFYGDDDVRLWMPRGIVALDNHQVNWISAVGNGRFYLSLTNSSPDTQRVHVTFDERLRAATSATVVSQGPRSPHDLTIEIPGHGHVAVILDGVGPIEPVLAGASEPAGGASYLMLDETPVGAVRAFLLTRPDGSGYDAYVQSACPTPAVLRSSADGGRTWTEREKPVHPSEWTVRLPPGASLRFRVRSGEAETEELSVSPAR